MYNQYASFASRVIAYIIDLFILSGILTVLTYLRVLSFLSIDYDLSQLQNPSYSLASNKGYMFLTFILGLIYYASLHASKWQATIGKKLMRIKVTTLEGRRISLIRAGVRYTVKFLFSSILFIGYLMVLFTKRKQALHDWVAQTIVVKN